MRQLAQPFPLVCGKVLVKNSSCEARLDHVILLNDRFIRLSQILTIAVNDEEFASQGRKYQTCWIFSSRPCEANFSPKLCRTQGETAELTASQGILLSSFLMCAAGFSSSDPIHSLQSLLQSPLAFWSAGGHQERHWRILKTKL